MVTVRPPTKPAEPLVLVELSHIINVSVPSPAPCHLVVPRGSHQPRPQAEASSSSVVGMCQCWGSREGPYGPNTLLGMGEGQGMKF